jgi:hypothetical protein
MTIKEAISHFTSHFGPLSLVKQVFPAHQSAHSFSHPENVNKPWMNVEDVELTAEDFA